MKWIKWDPAAFLEGVIGLSAEERGFYITLISLQYARAPHGDVTDELVIKAMACRPQVWRRIKKSLIANGKVHETMGQTGSKLTANRVETEVKLARNLMDKMTVLNAKRWKNKELASPGPEDTTTTTTTTTFKDARAREEAFNNSKEEKKAPSPNWRQSPSWRPRIDDEGRCPPRAKSDNVLVPISDRAIIRR